MLVGHSMGAMAIMRFTELYPEMQEHVDQIVLMDINCVPDKSDPALPRTLDMLK